MCPREADRLVALDSYEILDTPAEAGFERIVRLAQEIFGTPIALISFVGADRQWFKAKIGLTTEGTDRAAAFCNATIGGTDLLCVSDALADPRFRDFSLVTGAEGIRFYAGVPLLTADGLALGALCIMDRSPRPPLSVRENGLLRDLAAQVMSELELRREVAAGRRAAAIAELRERLLSNVVATSPLSAATRTTLDLVREAVEARHCVLWRLAADGRGLHIVAGSSLHPPDLEPLLSRLRALSLTVDNSRTGEVILGQKRVMLDPVSDADIARHPGLALLREFRAPRAVFAPLTVSTSRFALLLTFADETGGLAPAVALLDALTPVLLSFVRRLREAEKTQLFRRAVEASGDAVVVLDAAAEPGGLPSVAYVNRAFVDQTGFGGEEVIGRQPTGLRATEASRATLADLREALRSVRRFNGEIEFYRRSGEAFWAEVDVAPVADETGFFAHWIAILRDVSVKRRQAEQLAENEATFRNLFERHPSPMWLYDRESLAFLEVNEAAVETYGWTREQFLRMSILDIRPEEDREAVRLSSRRDSPTRRVTGPWRHKTARGGDRLVQILSCTLDYRGRPAVLVVVWDVTERLKAEQEAQALAQRLHATFESISDGLYTLDRTWRFTYVNRQAETLLQRPAEGLIGRRIWDEFPEAADLVLHERYHHAVDRQETVRFEFFYPPLARHFEISAYPTEDGLTVYFQDITERLKVEEQLREAQRLDAVGKLTGGIAHDFNNLLTVIIGSAELLSERLAEPDLRRLAEVTRKAAERGADLTHRMLAFARRQALDPTITDVNALAAGMNDLLRRTLGENIEIEFVRGKDLWPAMVDGPQLESAILNLCINARDAMPGGGRLTIETGNVHLDDVYASSYDDVPPGQYVLVAVSDTGAGMAPDVLSRAFEPFFTTKEVGRGSGLGLSMVFGFVKQSRGHIKIYSEAGEGTTVKLYLPRAEQEADEVAAGEPAPLRHGGSEKILLVEDDDLVREHVGAQLSRLGYAVVAARNGPEALELVRQATDLDLLFTDIVMPGGMNGRQLAEEAQRLRPELPVLFMSGYTENAIIHHGRLDPGVHLLQKPFRTKDLAAKIRQVIEHRRKG